MRKNFKNGTQCEKYSKMVQIYYVCKKLKINLKNIENCNYFSMLKVNLKI